MTFEEMKVELNNADDEPLTYKLMRENIVTLRDWFAGLASEEDIELYRELVKTSHKENYSAYSGIVVIEVNDYKYTREQARYRYADAMLKARKAPPHGIPNAN